MVSLHSLPCLKLYHHPVLMLMLFLPCEVCAADAIAIAVDIAYPGQKSVYRW